MVTVRGVRRLGAVGGMYPADDSIQGDDWTSGRRRGRGRTAAGETRAALRQGVWCFLKSRRSGQAGATSSEGSQEIWKVDYPVRWHVRRNMLKSR